MGELQKVMKRQVLGTVERPSKRLRRFISHSSEAVAAINPILWCVDLLERLGTDPRKSLTMVRNLVFPFRGRDDPIFRSKVALFGFEVWGGLNGETAAGNDS